MSIDQYRKKGPGTGMSGYESGSGTLPDGFGYNDPFCLSIGNPADKKDPDILMKNRIKDADLGRVQQAEIASRRDNCNNYTRP